MMNRTQPRPHFCRTWGRAKRGAPARRARPPYLVKNSDRETVLMSTKKCRTGYIAIRSTEDIQRALARRINRILMDQGEDHHGGQLAALCNSWLSVEKWRFELVDFRELKKQMEELSREIEEQRGR